jgi:AhpD family alkylhydroperoxidase
MAQRIDYQSLAAAGLRALGGAYMYVTRSGLPQSLINLVFLRASQVNGCAYCIYMHSRDLMKEGTSIDKVLMVSVWREIDGVFDARERAALRWTEAVTRIADTAASDTDFEALAQHFSEQEIADLTLAVSVINVYNRMSIAFRRQPGVQAG